MKIEYDIFKGQHCETNATGNLLNQQDIQLSEAMIFGLGEGLSFIFLNLSSFNLPFVGGRTKPFHVTKKLCDNLGLLLLHKETSSKKVAFNSLQKLLGEGKCVGLQLDSYYLDYFPVKIHFAGHFISVFGFDEEQFYVVDTPPKHKYQCSYKCLEKARFAKGPMAAKARYWTIENHLKKIELEKIIPSAIKNNANEYLSPPFKGASYKGIEKLASSLPKWLSSAKKPKEDLALFALMMENAGTGGSIFRNFYRDFLSESYDIVGDTKIKKARDEFTGIASSWHEVAEIIEETSKTLNEKLLKDASQLCKVLAEKEVETMKLLSSI